jgi:flagellar FliL protein
VALDNFTVNLNDGEENHYLRVTLNLGVEHMPAPLNKEKPNSGLPMARIRDTIVSVLTDCKAEALLTHEGKLQLKKNLVDGLNREVPDLGVREVYFTEFLVHAKCPRYPFPRPPKPSIPKNCGRRLDCCRAC